MDLVNLKTGTDSFQDEKGETHTAMIIRGVCASALIMKRSASWVSLPLLSAGC